MVADARTWFINELLRLHRFAGEPHLRDLAKMNSKLKTTTVSNLLTGKGVRTPDWDLVQAFVEACLKYSTQDGRRRSVEVSMLSDIEMWRYRHAQLSEWLDFQAKAWPTLPARVGIPPVTASAYVLRSADAELDAVWVSAEGGVVGRPSAIVLTGTSGLGKTQLAAAFVHRLWEAKKVDVAVWLTGSSRESVAAGYSAAAERVLGLSGVNADEAAKRFLEWLSQTSSRWVVVIDDVVEPSRMDGLWPSKSKTGMTIATSHHRGVAMVGDSRRAVEVGLFDEDVATDYLLETLALPAVQGLHARALAVELGCLPLALAHAVAFMRDFDLGCEEYLHRVADQKTKLESLFPEEPLLPDGYNRSVAAAWAFAVNQADVLYPRAVSTPLMQIASVLDSNGIVESIFYASPVIDYVARKVGRTVTNQDIRDGLRTLRRVSLVDLDEESEVVRVHSLIQRSVIGLTDTPVFVEAVGAAADAVSRAWNELSSDERRRQLLLPNIQALVAKASDELTRKACHPLLFQYISAVGDSGLYLRAAELARGLHGWATGNLPETHEHVLRLRLESMFWTGMAGHHQDAATFAAELLKDMNGRLGPNHELTLLCRMYSIRWRIEESAEVAGVEAYRQLVEDMERELGPHHEFTYRARNNMANVYGHAHDYAEAVAATEKLLHDRRERLGLDHPDTLLSRYNLAKWTGLDGQRSAAIDELAGLVPHLALVKGTRHPLTLYARAALARMQGADGDRDTAIGELREVAGLFEEIFGEQCPQSTDINRQIEIWVSSS
ncbi:tetratricopeptide repeat protein [Mycobacterium sp. 1245852.3]|uniref:tetratricopeptide repeat protein n=1 Tax=Mycobacterium sp. 1245852.3 TaxID=1856860 RepID=UPI0012EA710E|nr:tetratricopeptide repeat protein [Mycobacterium sp. 1245852.3]